LFINNGKEHHLWKGGKFVSDKGYIKVYDPRKANQKWRYVYEHRLVMEQYLGRKLKPNEDVHHKNGIKTDNRIENLQLITHGDHSIISSTIDMSDRRCLECGSDKTETVQYSKIREPRPKWLRHPITKEEWVCCKCYDKIRYSIHH
jgi:hypothetical protein